MIVSNDGDDRQKITVGGTPPLSTADASVADGDGTLLLVPDGRSEEQAALIAADYTDRIPNAPDAGGCWRATDWMVVPALAISIELDAGEKFRGGYAVLAAPDSGECLSPGEYRIEDTIHVTTPGGSDTVALSFSIHVGSR